MIPRRDRPVNPAPPAPGSAFDKPWRNPYSSTMRKRTIRLLTLALLVLAAPIRAQVLPFEVMGLKEGIPQSQVSALAQDREGYLWVGTWGGLSRFNGSEFKNFFLEDGLHSTRIQELMAASDGTLWVATVAGVSLWRDHRLEKLEDPSVSTVRCRALAEDPRRRIWIGTDNGVAVFAKGKFSLLHPGAGGKGPKVYDVIAYREGMLVAADNGLWRYVHDDAALPVEARAVAGPAAIDSADYRALAVTAEGIWLGTNGEGVWLLNDAGWRKLAGATATPRSIYRLAVEPSGTLYIATVDNGLFLKHPGQDSLEHWGVENGLPSNVVNVVLEDRESDIWIGTDIGGLARLSNPAVINHTEKQGLPSACVFGISPGDTPDSLWLGTMRGAVHYRVRPRPGVIETVRAKDGLDNEWVWKVLRTGDGTLWFMTDTALLFRKSGERTVRPLPPAVPFPRTNPYDMVLDGKGDLWGCGEWSGGGLARRDAHGRWRIWNRTAAGEPLTAVHHLARRQRGGVYAVAKSAFYFCDGETVFPLAVRSRCPLEASVSITAILEDNRGRLWAGSDAGLAVLDTDGRWLLLNDRPGFANHHIFYIGEDWKGTVWVNTARGVFRFLADYKVEEFTPDDGLADWETNANGFFSDAHGDIWIGTVNGLSQYNPARRSANTEPPRLIVENVRMPRRSSDYPRRLNLGWNERTLIFNIAVLSYRSRNRTAYRYRMDGMENEWQQGKRNSGELRYTNLPAGDLKLLLQPVNESGLWGATVTLPVHVRPPFWMALWFRLGMLFFIVASAVGIYRWRTLLLRRRNRELESEVGKRTAELEYLATYDPLTTLLNRRAILALLEKQLRPVRGSNRQLGCIMVDLNRFKQVNDTLGHAAGDQVLREMAAKIQECLRQGDALGRLGGDEFLVILPGADREALQSVERRISGLACRAGEGDAAVTVTAACGAVEVPPGNIAAAAAVLARADDLLYQVKRAGSHRQA
jgi:diguanylate cyclase (GGDEF)-like protein